ncbi:histidine kinase [Mucilaginibacter gracilis]|uniref:Histidine kinase n=1 Tax=Mucilaginibacter gracilis TaxID=423350 RepID=A0A495IXH9_9SPHI|nr:histidine kinase [Mucilaginibacter gracilis]RKR80768.1 histidine kinase [Mucilaginibacter gracilis]
MLSLSKITRLRSIIFSVHFAVLLGLLVFTCVPLTITASLPIQIWTKQLVLYATLVGIFYLHLRVLVPRLLYNNRGGIFALLVFLICIAVPVLNHQADKLMDLPGLLHRFAPKRPVDVRYTPVGDLSIMIITMIVIGIAIIISVTGKVQADLLKEKSLENDRIAGELAVLRSQINPHFFFNVLHTIYGLTEIDTDRAREAIYTLSHMMRYVLYETRHQVTTLEKELRLIDSYRQLMQLRLPPHVTVVFNQPAGPLNIPLSPMLLLPFVENAFKHGISTVQPSYIYISAQLCQESFRFEVRNTLFAEPAKETDEGSGIGLANTRRRLELIYPGKYKLNVKEDHELEEFRIELQITLT